MVSAWKKGGHWWQGRGQGQVIAKTKTTTMARRESCSKGTPRFLSSISLAIVFFRETFKRSPGRVMYIQTYMITRLDVPPLRNEHSSLPDLKPCILVKLEWNNISQKTWKFTVFSKWNNKILYILRYSKENAALLLHILNEKKRTTNISGKGLEIYVFTAKLEGSCSCFCIIQAAPNF